MPKWKVNEKKEEARENEQAKKGQQKSKAEKEKEDSKWVETDPIILKKQAKQIEEAKKQAEKIKKEQEKKELYEKEQLELAKIKQQKLNGMEMKALRKQGNDSAQQIEDKMYEKYAQKGNVVAQNRQSDSDEDIDVQIDAEFGHLYKFQKGKFEKEANNLEAEGLNEAVEKMELSGKEGDLHPERRMKKAWAVYQEKNLERERKDNPSLNRHKLVQLMWEQFKKSPQNPMNGEANVEWVDGKPVKK